MYSSYDIGLSALLESDISSYEYFHSLPAAIQSKITALDLGSYDEMIRFVKSQRSEY